MPAAFLSNYPLRLGFSPQVDDWTGRVFSGTLFPMQKPEPIIIAGQGNAARVTALSLAAAKIPVAIEPPVPPLEMGDWQSVLALSPRAKTMLSALNVWARLDLPEAPICDMQVFGTKAAIGDDILPSQLGFAPNSKDEKDAVDPLGHIVSLAALGRALHESLEAAIGDGQISVLPAAIKDFEATAQSVTLADGSTHMCALLVDSRRDNSGSPPPWRARSAAAALRHDYKAKALVGRLTCAQPHGQIATQIFLPDGPLAVLPLPDPHRRALVWSLPAAKADALAAGETDWLVHELNHATQDRLGVLTPAGEMATQSLALYLAQEFCAPHHVLVGEAAHIVHPMAGQGFNLSLRDAALLADVLYEARALGLAFHDAAMLETYAQTRHADAAQIAATTHGLARLFQTRLAGLGQMGLGLVGALAKNRPSLQARLAAEANGGAETATQPRLMRGAAYR